MSIWPDGQSCPYLSGTSPGPATPRFFMNFLFTTLQRFRLLSLTVAWVAGVASILLAEPSGPVAVAGAYAFGLFILLTVVRLRWDSLVILSVLGGVTWFLVGAVPTPEDILSLIHI